MKRILFVSGVIALLSSCSMGKLTSQQQQKLLEIDNEINKLWIEYEFKTDSLFIEKDNIINNTKK